MRAVRFQEHGGPEVLRVEEVERPDPGPGEVVVEVRAAGVNPVDTYVRDGAYAPAELPFTPGVDVAGVVDETGAGVEAFAAGDRVYGTGIGIDDRQGAYAEYAAVPADMLAALPETVPFREAGAAGVAAFTAWRALIDHAGLGPTEDCLVHGASGGVGHVAVQVAAAAGASVVGTAGPEYHDRVGALGADTVLDYGREDLGEAVRGATGGGADVVLDHRLDDYLQFDAEVAATGGHVVGIGENDPAVGFSNVGTARSADVTYTFMIMFNAPDYRAILSPLADLMAAGDLSIEVAEAYDLEEAGAAQVAVLEESFLGKLVIEP